MIKCPILIMLRLSCCLSSLESITLKKMQRPECSIKGWFQYQFFYRRRMIVTCVLTYIIALIPLKCFCIPQDDSKLFSKVDIVELENPLRIEDIIIVNEKKNSRDFWAKYLARFKDSKIWRHDKRGQQRVSEYLSGFSSNEAKRGSFSMFSPPSIAYQIYKILNDRRLDLVLYNGNGLHNRIM